MNLKNIGSNIKKLRLKKGLTQAQLVEIVNISTVHMSHIETGSVAMSLDSLISISNGLDTTPDSILLGEYNISAMGASEILNKQLQNISSDEKRLLIEFAKLLEEMKINRK